MRGRDLAAPKPAAVEARDGLHGAVGCLEADVDLSLLFASILVGREKQEEWRTWDSLTTKISATLPYLDSASPLTSSRSSRSQSRSVSSSGLNASRSILRR